MGFWLNRIIFILGTPYLIRNASLSLSIFIAFFKSFIIIKKPLGWLFLS
ncbi:hypothetical protein HPNQ4216_0526 [Helicobacter pylori NQ4216]|nr:hypothetical protein HPNQ4216_0526 [Helicobacter pylori NQ4216]